MNPFGSAWHPRPLERFPDLARVAAELLHSPPALLGLSAEEARAVVLAMVLFDIPKGATGLRLYDVQGRMRWEYRKESPHAAATLAWPHNLEKGVWHVRYVP